MGELLNEDLILLIFSKLPLKTLFRFKCLSRHWRELLQLTTDSIVKQQREQSNKNPKVLLLHDDLVSLSSMKLLELDHDNDHDGETILLHNQFTAFLERTYIEILPCSKGEIVCLAATANNLFYVCNPSTRELVCLPEPSSPFTQGHEPDSAFGYIPSKDEYKLVHLYTDQFGITRGEMFTLSSSDREEVGSSHSWKLIEQECPHEVQGNGVMVNNIFYWVTYKEQHQEHEERKSILSFDLETETFGTIACPPEGCEHYVKVVELEGSLCVLDNFFQNSTMVIWMLKDSTGENNTTPLWLWERKYSIYVPVPVHFDHYYFMEDVVPVYARDGEIILHDMKRSIYYYNIKTEKLRRVANRIISRMEIGLYIDGPFPLRKWIIEYP